MYRNRFCLAATLVGAICCTDLSATITVTRSGGTSVPSTWYEVTIETDGSFTVTLMTGMQSGATTFEIRGAPTDDINAIRIEFSSAHDVTVNILQAANFDRVRDLRLIVNDDPTNVNVFVTAIEIGGDLGDICDIIELDGVNVFGDLIGNIEMFSDPGSSGSGSIGDIVVLGDITSQLIDAKATIGSIDANKIGSATASTTIFANGGIDSIISSGAVHAGIDVRDSNGVGGIRNFFAASFGGTMKIQQVTPSETIPGNGKIELTGNLNGDILIDEAFSNLSTFTDPMNVGRTLTIKTGFAGLKGQVVINAENGGHEWKNGARVIVGSTVLTSREYTNLASSLGGGSAGEAAFKLHDESSNPASGGSVPDTGGNITARLRHYGSIEFNATPASVDVWDDSTSQWLALPASEYTFAVDSADDRTLKVTENGGPTHGFRAGFTYRIRPTGNLKSSGVTGTPGVVHNADYTFSVAASGGGCQTCLCSNDPDCPLGGMLLSGGPDFNQNGIVGLDDVEMSINAMGNSGGRFDVNADGFVDSADVAIVVEAIGSHPEERFPTGSFPRREIPLMLAHDRPVELTGRFFDECFYVAVGGTGEQAASATRQLTARPSRLRRVG